MKAFSLFLLVTIFCLPGPRALADGVVPLLDAERITYDGVIIKTTKGEDGESATFKVNKTGEVITLKYDDVVSQLEGVRILENLKPGTRVLIQRYRGSKGAKYAKEEGLPLTPGRNTRNYDGYILTLKATGKPRPK